MTQTIPQTMRAAAIDQFGGPDVLTVRSLPVPEVGPDEVLIHVHTASVGPWDPMLREGTLFQGTPHFPMVIGGDGAGTVVAVGDQVDRFAPGDQVYADAFMNPKGGMYAEYAAVKVDAVGHVPDGLSIEQAGALPIDAITGLRGLDDTLHLAAHETLAILGASGGIGQIAVQFAKRRGARVLAIAAGADGVALARQLGADAVVDGKADDAARRMADAARDLAPDGLDAVLATTGGDVLTAVIAAVRDGGRVAFPHGVQPEPQGRAGVTVTGYDGQPDRDIIDRVNALITEGPFQVHIARSFPLDQAGQALEQLKAPHVGKYVLAIDWAV